MEIGKEKAIKNEQGGSKGEGKEREREKKARGRPTKAEELRKQRGRTDSLGSIKEFIQKRKRDEVEEETARAEREILEKFNEIRKTNRSPPIKVKKGEERKDSMAAEEMLKEILRKMEEQEKERKKDKEEIKKEIKGLKEEFEKREETWERQRKTMEESIKNLEEKVERMGQSEAEGKKERELIGKVKEIERNIEMADRKGRKNNIIVKEARKGSEKDRKEKIKKIIEEVNKEKIIIEEMQEIGRGEYRMTILRCKSWEIKREIMGRKKEIGKRYEIFLDDDLTKEEREIQKEIRRLARKEKEEGKRAMIGYQRVWIDNKEMRWSEERGRLEEKSTFRKA